VIPVLVIAVQNVVPYSDLGVATSGVTFFRSIGGSFGTAVFGAIFTAQLSGNLIHYLAGTSVPAGFSASAGASPAALAKLPPAVHSGFVHAYATSLHTVFLVAVPITAVAFVLTWLLKEVPLRKTSTATNPADTLAPTSVPAARSSVDEISRALSVLASGPVRQNIYQRLATRAGLSLDPRSCWLLLRINDHPGHTPEALASALDVPVATLQPLLAGLSDQGLTTTLAPAGGNGAPAAGVIRLTGNGEAAATSLATARHDAVSELVQDWPAEDRAELANVLTRLARHLLPEHAHAS
jgi:DNA-binding MarR family transcriptional regulator